MKKLLLLLIILISGLSFGQDILVNGNFETWTDNHHPEGWSTAQNITKESNTIHGGTYSAKQENPSSKATKKLKEIINDIIPGDTYVLTINYKVESGDGTDARIWSAWKNGSDMLNDYQDQLHGPQNNYLDNNNNQWATYTTTMTAPANATSFSFEVRTYTGATVYWDDFSFEHQAPSTPTLTITEPTPNQVFSPETSDVNVSFVVQNFNVASGGTGDGYIKWTLDSGSSNDKFDTEPIQLTALSSGQHTVNMELVDNSGNSLSTAVTSSVTFEIAQYTQVANLAALRAGTIGEYYEVTGEIFLIKGYSLTSGAVKAYLQDNTAGIMVYAPSGVITSTYNPGDGITGAKGKLNEYHDVLQLVASTDPGAATSTGHTFTPQSVSLADYIANHEDYESELIKIGSVTIDPAGDTNFQANHNYNITDGTNTAVLRTIFDDLANQPISTSLVDITGIAGQFNSTIQIFPRDINDIVEVGNGILSNNIDGLQIYPNPVINGTFYVSTPNNTKKQISIYNIQGKQVFNSNINNAKSISVSSLKSGIYIIKVTENNKTSIQKLMIK